MAASVIDSERKKYETMWGFDSYRERSPGLRHLDDAMSRLKPQVGDTIVDLGCGTGRVSVAMRARGLEVTAVDIASNACKEWDGPFYQASVTDLPDSLPLHDYGFCADVMEHLPTECVDDALVNISRHAKVTYFQIANFVCHEGDKIGEHLHLTVEPFDWWQKELSKHFHVVDGHAAPKHHIFVCRSLAF